MDNISKVYEKLLSLKSTKLILDDGRGRKLYDVAISPAFRTKYFKYNSPQKVDGFELKTKSDITGNVYEKGWVLIDNRQQLKDRQPNPRPRKYASDAERQAAFRNRASMLEFRADEKTAEKLTEIADTLDISRSDLLLSMVKFALTNHQWARFGLTHKTLPRYEENPMATKYRKNFDHWTVTYSNGAVVYFKTEESAKAEAGTNSLVVGIRAPLYSDNPIMATKKFSPAQIAAQKLFAERARAGTLGKGTKRKANPDTEMSLGGNKYGKVRPSADGYGGQIFTASYYQKSKTGFKNEVETDLIETKKFKTMNGATKWLASQNRKTNPGLSNQEMIDNFAKKLIRRVKHRMDDFGDSYSKAKAMVSLESVAGESAWAVVDKYFEGAKRKTNPDKAKRASQATGAPPSKRLVKRRTKALLATFPFCVETKATENWSIKTCFKTMQPAKEYAVALSKQYPNLTIRVMHYAGGAM